MLPAATGRRADQMLRFLLHQAPLAKASVN